MAKEISLERFVRKVRGERLAPAAGVGTLCGLFLETDDRTGLAIRVEPIRIGGQLREARPA